MHFSDLFIYNIKEAIYYSLGFNLIKREIYRFIELGK